MRKLKIFAVSGLFAAAIGCSDGIDKEVELQEAMERELLRLATAQEGALQANGGYTANVRAILNPPPANGFSLTVLFVSPSRWGAEVANAESSSHCAMYVGVGEQTFLQRWPGIQANEPTCKPLPTGTGK